EQVALDELVSRLRAAVRRRYGEAAAIEDVSVATLGGSSRTLLFDLVEGEGRRRLVFRQETYRLAGSPFIAPHAQFRLLQIAAAHGIPVPSPEFELDELDGLGRAHVVGYVAGETLPRRLLTDPRYEAARAGFATRAG